MSGHSAENGLLIPSHWNPHWNYHLGGEPRSICACPDGPYEGARLVTTPRFCERCGGLVSAAVTRQSPGGQSLTYCCCDRTTARLVVCPVHPEATPLPPGEGRA